MTFRIPLDQTLSIGSGTTFKYPDQLSNPEGGDFAHGAFYNAVQATNPIRYYRMFSGSGATTEPDLGSDNIDATHNANSDLSSVGPQKDISPAGRDFDGTEATTANPVTSLSGSTEATFAMWFFNRDITTDQWLFSTNISSSTNDRINMWADINNSVGSGTNGFSWQMGSGSAPNRLYIPNDSLQGVWQYLVGTINGTEKKFYVDGILEGSSDTTAIGSIATQTQDLNIGQQNSGCNGYIADVTIWDRELSAQEIANLYLSATVSNVIVKNGDSPFTWDNWSTGSCSITTSYGTAPDRTSTTILLESTGGGVFDNTRYLIEPSGGFAQDYCFSVWAKSGTSSVFNLLLRTENPGSSRSGQNFDLSTGALSGAVTGTASDRQSGIEDCGDGWYRCWVSGTCVHNDESTEDVRAYTYPAQAGSVNLGDNVELWNPQIHVGAGPPKPVIDPRKYPNTSD